MSEAREGRKRAEQERADLAESRAEQERERADNLAAELTKLKQQLAS